MAQTTAEPSFGPIFVIAAFPVDIPQVKPKNELVHQLVTKKDERN